MKQLWFPGNHNDVGGGRTPTDGDVGPRLSHMSLRWLIREAASAGLHFDATAVITSPIYLPFVPELEKRLAGIPGPDLSATGPAGVAARVRAEQNFANELLKVATEKTERMFLDARATRGDELSLSIQRKKGGLFDYIGAIPGRIQQKFMTVTWWILESVSLPRACFADRADLLALDQSCRRFASSGTSRAPSAAGRSCASYFFLLEIENSF